jgi:hypothetical protein
LAVEVVEQYVAEIRPCFGAPRHPAMFLTERGTRIALAYINIALVGAPNLTGMNARSRSETMGRDPRGSACDRRSAQGEMDRPDPCSRLTAREVGGLALGVKGAIVPVACHAASR